MRLVGRHILQRQFNVFNLQYCGSIFDNFNKFSLVCKNRYATDKLFHRNSEDSGHTECYAIIFENEVT